MAGAPAPACRSHGRALSLAGRGIETSMDEREHDDDAVDGATGGAIGDEAAEDAAAESADSEPDADASSDDEALSVDAAGSDEDADASDDEAAAGVEASAVDSGQAARPRPMWHAPLRLDCRAVPDWR